MRRERRMQRGFTRILLAKVHICTALQEKLAQSPVTVKSGRIEAHVFSERPGGSRPSRGGALERTRYRSTRTIASTRHHHSSWNLRDVPPLSSQRPDRYDPQRFASAYRFLSRRQGQISRHSNWRNMAVTFVHRRGECRRLLVESAVLRHSACEQKNGAAKHQGVCHVIKALEAGALHYRDRHVNDQHPEEHGRA